MDRELGRHLTAQKLLELSKEGRMPAFEALGRLAIASVEELVNEALQLEMDKHLKATPGNRRNGLVERKYMFSGLGTIAVRMPVDRQNTFTSSFFPKNERMDPRVSKEIADLHMAGLFTRSLGALSEQILGAKVGRQTVANSIPSYLEEAQSWLERPLGGEDIWCLVFDATFFHIRRKGGVGLEAAMIIQGIDRKGLRSILAATLAPTENTDTWTQAFGLLKDRGLRAENVELGVMDGLTGLDTVFLQEFPAARAGHCWFHAIKAATAELPMTLAESFRDQARLIWKSESSSDAREAFKALKKAFTPFAPWAVKSIESKLETLLTHMSFPKAFRAVTRTTNGVERTHREFKRRTDSMDGIGEKSLIIFLSRKCQRNTHRWHQRPLPPYPRPTGGVLDKGLVHELS